MFDKPNLSEDRIVAGARDSYGVSISELEFLPLGHDPYAWVYRARSVDGPTYFLKLRKGAVSLPSVTVPRALRDAGVSAVVAPLTTSSGVQPWGTIDDYAVLLYPFIQAESGMKVGLTDAQWTRYGAILRQVHAATLPESVLRQVPSETFVSDWCNRTHAFLAGIDRRDPTDPRGQQVVATWREKRDEIARIVARSDELGRALRARAPQFVTCHTDPHPNNLLIDGDGQVHLVDWDAPLLAPKERDLHFAIESVFVPNHHAEDLVLRGYGPTEIDWLALAYYRWEWVCGDLIAYAETALATEDVGELAKDDAVRATREMFEPGNSVASADDVERLYRGR